MHLFQGLHRGNEQGFHNYSQSPCKIKSVHQSFYGQPTDAGISQQFHGQSLPANELICYANNDDIYELLMEYGVLASERLRALLHDCRLNDVVLVAHLGIGACCSVDLVAVHMQKDTLTASSSPQCAMAALALTADGRPGLTCAAGSYFPPVICARKSCTVPSGDPLVPSIFREVQLLERCQGCSFIMQIFAIHVEHHDSDSAGTETKMETSLFSDLEVRLLEEGHHHHINGDHNHANDPHHGHHGHHSHHSHHSGHHPGSPVSTPGAGGAGGGRNSGEHAHAPSHAPSHAHNHSKWGRKALGTSKGSASFHPGVHSVTGIVSSGSDCMPVQPMVTVSFLVGWAQGGDLRNLVKWLLGMGRGEEASGGTFAPSRTLNRAASTAASTSFGGSLSLSASRSVSPSPGADSSHSRRASSAFGRDALRTLTSLSGIRSRRQSYAEEEPSHRASSRKVMNAFGELVTAAFGGSSSALLMSESAIRFYTGCLISGLMCLHGMCVVHRDLKLANFLIDADGYVLIGDLGTAMDLSTTPGGRLHARVGSPGYMAPEVDQQQAGGYGLPADLWSLGVCIFNLATGHLPFGTHAPSPSVEVASLIPTQVSPELRDLLTRLLDLRPQARPRVEEVAAHRWFMGFDWGALTRREMEPPQDVPWQELMWQPNINPFH